jgi:hypothetical protein
VALDDTLSGYSAIAAGSADGLAETDLLYAGRLPRG